MGEPTPVRDCNATMIASSCFASPCIVAEVQRAVVVMLFLVSSPSVLLRFCFPTCPPLLAAVHSEASPWTTVRSSLVACGVYFGELCPHNAVSVFFLCWFRNVFADSAAAPLWRHFLAVDS